jgi:3-isopropylmalate dehydratase/3-isopropylmalate/(R)-2-methylmalate dehydratase small subunit
MSDLDPDHPRLHRRAMQPFTHLTAKAVPLDIANLDTDQIIPKQFLKTVEREGLAKGLFYDLRFDADGRAKPDFVLNDPRYAGAGVLVAGDNFGCGSSREHAAWALLDYGVRCVIAPSFADIFYNNCFQNGVLPIALPEAAVRALMDEARGGNHVFEVDLAAQLVTAPSGARFAFDIDPGRKAKLLEGLDAIGETLAVTPAIDRFEHVAALTRPWLGPA